MLEILQTVLLACSLNQAPASEQIKCRKETIKCVEIFSKVKFSKYIPNTPQLEVVTFDCVNSISVSKEQ